MPGKKKKIDLVPIGWWAEGACISQAMFQVIEGPIADLGHAPADIAMQGMPPERDEKLRSTKLKCSSCGLVGDGYDIERIVGKRKIYSAVFSGELFMIRCKGKKKRVDLRKESRRMYAMRAITNGGKTS